MVRLLAVLMWTVATLVAATPARAATLLFVDVPGIPGRSILDQAKDQIEALSYSFGVAPSKATKYGTVGVCAPGQTKPMFSEFCVTKQTDITSPKLFVAAATAAQFPLVTISLFRTGGDNTKPIVLFALANAFVSSMHTDATITADVPTEQVCFRFNRAQVTTTRQKDTGQTVSETAGFDACQSSPF